MSNHRLTDLGITHGTDKATFHRYTEFYGRRFDELRFVPKRVLEVGVRDGASLRMWREYWPDAEIVGIDIKAPIEVPGCTVLQMNATKEMPEGKFDFIMEDAGHYTLDQMVILVRYWEILNPGGIYSMEDLMTSHMGSHYRQDNVNAHFWVSMLRNAEVWQRDPGVLTNCVTSFIYKGWPEEVLAGLPRQTSGRDLAVQQTLA